MGMPVITPSETTRTQAVTDIIESVALQETALSHILNAEGEKIQKMVALPDVTPEVLLDIRRKRIKKAAGKAGGGQFAMLAKNYADPEYIYRDLEASRALMRRLGCIVVHTEGRAVEETAQEILRYYERSHPSNTDIID